MITFFPTLHRFSIISANIEGRSKIKDIFKFSMGRALTKYDLSYSYVPPNLKNCHYFLRNWNSLRHPLVSSNNLRFYIAYLGHIPTIWQHGTNMAPILNFWGSTISFTLLLGLINQRKLWIFSKSQDCFLGSQLKPKEC